MPEYSFEDNSEEYIDIMTDKIQENMTGVTETYESRIKEELDTPPERTGRIYQTPTGEHQASAPGEPPAPYTRQLIDSVDTDFIQEGEGFFEGYTYSTAPYVLSLEFGLSDKNLLPRPAWQPVFFRYMSGFANIATQGFNRKGTGVSSTSGGIYG